jgi:large subunit ribosomal protein L23
MKVLIKPIITEKATNDSEMNNRYTFLVSNSSNKLEIKKAVESNYGVKVEKVRTLNYGPVRKTKFTKTGIQRGKTKILKRL